MQLIQWFIDNPVKITVGVLLVVLFGVISLFSIPMQLTPEVEIPTITVTTLWPGASPQEVERKIVQEQEEQLKSVEGVLKMSAESMDSMGKIIMEFPVGTVINEALLKVNTKLQQVREYPEDADEPVLSTTDANANAIAWFILSPRLPTPDEILAFQAEHPELQKELDKIRLSHNPGLATKHLYELAKTHPEVKPLLPPEVDVTKLRKFGEDFLEARFERVTGVANANILGGQTEELQVVIDPQALAARQLTIGDVRRALREQNADTSGGDLWEGKRRYVIRTLGQFRTPEQVSATIVARRDDVPVYVRDVAEVRLGFTKPDGFVRRYGSPCVAINAQRETGANVLNVMTGLRAANKELNEGILKTRGLQLTQVYDETDYIYSAVDTMWWNLAEGGILTILILLAFLKSIRSTMIIAVTIPVSIIGTFVAMQVMGRSLNVISLAGLAFAVGMFVDNAIVVLENIFRHWEMGKSPAAAAVQGTSEVWGAVVASTLTNLAVFVPVLFVQQEAGQLFRDIALAISAALALSLIVSAAVVPTAAARMLGKQRRPPHDGHGNGHPSASAALPSASAALPVKKPRRWYLAPVRLFDSLGNVFVNFVVGLNRFLLRNIFLKLATGLVFVVGALWLSWVLMPKAEYLPNGNRNLVFGILVPPPGYNLDEMVSLGEVVENELRPYWDVDLRDPKVKELGYPPIADFFYVARGRQVFLGLRSTDPDRVAELVPLIQKVTTKLPGTFVVAAQSSLFERGLSAGRSIDIEITGPELPKLVQLGFGVLTQVQGAVPKAQARPLPSLDLSSPEVHIIPKLEQAADMRLSAAELGYAVNALIDGAYASDFLNDGDKIDLTIIGNDRFVTRTQDIGSLPIAVPTGEVVTLAHVANITISSGPEQINRRERQRAITIQVTPPPEFPLELAIDKIQEMIVQPMIAKGLLDGGLYRINLAGTADKLKAARDALKWNLLLALLITYLLMAALFESWLHPFVIILSVPLGAVGGIIGLVVMNMALKPFNMVQPLDVLTMLGFVILIGTVVNNPILIIHQALNHMREDGMAQIPAILESVRTRIRPIFMTLVTTVIGLLPMVVSPGQGSELYRGLGCVLLGGLISSTFFTLILVPTMFSLTLQVKAAFVWLLGFSNPRDDSDPLSEPALSGVASNANGDSDIHSSVEKTRV